MAGWWLVLAALVASGPADDVRALAAGLSAPRRAERERAARRLEALGEAARPALLEAAGSNDLELRGRAAAVLDAIEGQALGRPTPVTLDFRDVPLGDVVEAVSDRTGLGLACSRGPTRGGANAGSRSSRRRRCRSGRRSSGSPRRARSGPT